MITLLGEISLNIDPIIFWALDYTQRTLIVKIKYVLLIFINTVIADTLLCIKHAFTVVKII